MEGRQGIRSWPNQNLVPLTSEKRRIIFYSINDKGVEGLLKIETSFMNFGAATIRK